MQAAARSMRDRGEGGRIVNIASIAGKGYRGTSNVAYTGTKGAVIAMTRISASQLARYDINVNAICPGVTRTALFDQVIDGLVDRLGGTREEAEARAVRSIPLRRANEPADIAALAVYLASDARPQCHRSVLEPQRRPALGLRRIAPATGLTGPGRPVWGPLAEPASEGAGAANSVFIHAWQRRR